MSFLLAERSETLQSLFVLGQPYQLERREKGGGWGCTQRRTSLLRPCLPPSGQKKPYTKMALYYIYRYLYIPVS